jgi:hypothetical protein
MRPVKKLKFENKVSVLFHLSGLILLQALPGLAVQSVTLGWNPSPSMGVRSYQVCYGTLSQNYDHTLAVSGNTTNATVWGLVGGQTYYFAARAIQGMAVKSDFSAELTYTVPPDAANQPPILTQTLTPKTFVVGQNLALSVAAIGTGTLNYQWNFNGQILPDATNAVLVLNNATTDQAGTYFVTVTDDIGTTNSIPADLTLHVAAASTQVAATLTPVTGLATMNDGSSQYVFDVSGLAGSTYVVQSSTNLQDWVSVQTNVAPFTYVETNASQSVQQYYRAFN